MGRGRPFYSEGIGTRNLHEDGDFGRGVRQRIFMEGGAMLLYFTEDGVISNARI